MNITLTPEGEELLRAALDRHPGRTAAEIVEQALAERVAREQASAPSVAPQRKRTPGEIRAWLDELAQFSNKIPPMPGESFSREMIYQDHD